MTITIFQTLEDRGNPDFVIQNAPFSCHWQNTWLGDGFYFWDSFIENAHWWGTMRYKNQYIISKATCDYDESNCFDLVGNTAHMLDFDNSIKFLKTQGLLSDTTTVAHIIKYLKQKVGGFNYQAIRAYGIKSISEHKEEYLKYRHRLTFEPAKPQYLDYKPAIQLCIFEKNGLHIRNLEIAFPDYYCADYVV